MPAATLARPARRRAHRAASRAPRAILAAAGLPVLTRAEAVTAMGTGLGAASKMPGRTFGLSARDCKVGAKLARIQGSTCSGCYALKGHYAKSTVTRAHAKRMAALVRALAVPAAADAWVAGAVTLIGATREPFFRWHDSGDLQSVDHLRLIVRVARLLPHFRFWIPTRERGIVADWRAAGGKRPANLTIRVSDGMVDQTHRNRMPGTVTSGVHHATKPAGRTCPAPAQGNACGDCRACWNPRIAHVSYHKH
jgi:hypothetical protein